jgi:hypothetical protein
LVDVSHVGDVDLFIDDDGRVVVVDDNAVDARVAYVDRFAVATADGIRRDVDFARTEWEPADVSPDGDSKVRTADPGDERRRVNGANVGDTDNLRRSRYPAPDSADDNPAAVVEGSETPGFVLYPGVAPRHDINPMAVAVRSPADDGSVRKPDGAVFGDRTPAAIIVEIFVADDVGRDIAS